MMLLRLLAVFVVLAVSCGAQSRRNTPRGNPGEFDYYLMSLSWSPQHCATNGASDRAQCGGNRHFGFVLHGLWPQYERGFPDSCAPGGDVSQGIIDHMLPMMPSPRLISHEWERHGTCSGLDQQQYFSKAEQAFRSFKSPARYVNPKDAIRLAPDDLKKELLQANPGIREAGMTVLCSGRFLQEVRVCLTKDLQPRACGRDALRDACAQPEIIVQPIR